MQNELGGGKNLPEAGAELNEYAAKEQYTIRARGYVALGLK